MNRLAPAPGSGDDADDSATTGDRYLLPKHAHFVVYERDEDDEGDPIASKEDTGGDDRAGGEDAARAGRQLVTIYDCGAAQKPPSAQLLGTLGSVRADCETTQNPTGYVISMRERAVLVDEGDGHYVVRSR